MSNYSTTLDARSAVDTSARRATPGFWQRLYARLIAGRQEQARRHVEAYINRLSEQERKDLGFPTSIDRR